MLIPHFIVISCINMLHNAFILLTGDVQISNYLVFLLVDHQDHFDKFYQMIFLNKLVLTDRVVVILKWVSNNTVRLISMVKIDWSLN